MPPGRGMPRAGFAGNIPVPAALQHKPNDIRPPRIHKKPPRNNKAALVIQGGLAAW